MNKKHLIFIIVIIAAIAGYFVEKGDTTKSQWSTRVSLEQQEKSSFDSSNRFVDQHSAVHSAYLSQKSNVEVQGSGVVKIILKDDHEGVRHQKFVLRLDDGLTVLVAHNTDLASRIQSLKKGDIVEFKGEYEYNPKGGVIHWTHRDPRGQHPDGWLRYQGRIYQ